MDRFHQAAKLSRGDQRDIFGAAAANYDRLARGCDLVAQGGKVGAGVGVASFGRHGESSACTETLYVWRFGV